MTDPTVKPGKGRLIVNVILLVLNLIISVYLFQFGRPLLGLLFLALGLRNAYIIYTTWRDRR